MYTLNPLSAGLGDLAISWDHPQYHLLINLAKNIEFSVINRIL
jgi:hypothetical protein